MGDPLQTIPNVPNVPGNLPYPPTSNYPTNPSNLPYPPSGVSVMILVFSVVINGRFNRLYHRCSFRPKIHAIILISQSVCTPWHSYWEQHACVCRNNGL